MMKMANLSATTLGYCTGFLAGSAAMLAGARSDARAGFPAGPSAFDSAIRNVTYAGVGSMTVALGVYALKGRGPVPELLGPAGLSALGAMTCVGVAAQSFEPRLRQ